MIIPICSILLQGASSVLVILIVILLGLRGQEAGLNNLFYSGIRLCKSAYLPLNQHLGEPNAPAKFLKQGADDGRSFNNGYSFFEKAFLQCKDG